MKNHLPSTRIFWHINREAVILLGGLRALLMQIAHPAIAAGVYEHSDWQTQPYRRFLRTLWLINQIVHGKESTARKALHAINLRHAKIHGNYHSAKKNKEFSYSANDLLLKKWVLSTLVDSSLYAYERWVGNLSQSECQLNYHRWKDVAKLFEIPSKVMPEDYESFQRYFENMLHSCELIIDEKTKRLANSLLSTNHLLRNFNFLLASSTLPNRLRDAYDLQLDTIAEKQWRKYDQRIRQLVRFTPPLFRCSPIAILAKLK